MKLDDDIGTVIVSTCPDCGAHLEDTWDGGACGRCGFAYVNVQERYRSPSSLDSAEPGPSLMGSMVAVTLAWIAGNFFPYIYPVTSGDTGFAINFGPGEPALALALLTGAILLLVGDSVRRAVR